MENYYTVKEFAYKLHVSTKTVLDWIKKKKIDSEQVVPHGRHLISKLNVPAFMRKKK
jgi:excisionase family DNA binding protein